MRLYMPHISAGAFSAGATMAGVIFWPQFGVGILITGSICMSVVTWICTIRYIEYLNLTELFKPAVQHHLLKPGFWETIDYILDRPIITAEFFLTHIQKSRGCRGRHRVIIAVLSEQLNKTWEDAEKMLSKHHVTHCTGTTWKDYFIPGWS